MGYYYDLYCIYIWFDHVLLFEKDSSAWMLVLNTGINSILCVFLGFMKEFVFCIIHIF
jgi:hypothetical protein